MMYDKAQGNRESVRIKAIVTIPMVWEDIYGSPPGKLNSCKVPWREDEHPSFWISPDGQRWQDRGRSDSGDVFDFVKKAKDCDAGQAFKYLLARAGGNHSALKPEPVSKRQYHPRLRQPTMGELVAISTLRAISTEGLQLAVARGFLWMTKYAGFSAWMVTDRTRKCYVARKLDGTKWERINQYPMILTGGNAKWPIGILEGQDYQSVALCEGPPDFLAAFGHAWASGVETQIAPVCLATGAVYIADDALPYFAGKRVRIFAHNDAAGHRTYERWAGQLQGIATKIDGFDFTGLIQTDGQPVTDLNDLSRIDYDCWEANRDRIESIMDF